MKNVWSRVRSAAAVLAVACAGLFATDAFAGDKVVLKDGTIVEGTIVREVEGYIWVKFSSGGLEREQMYRPDEVKSVERDAPAGEPAKHDPGAAPSSGPVMGSENPPALKHTGAPRAAVITLGSRDEDQGDTVGIYMTAHALKEMLPKLEEELGTDGSGVVVFRVTSGGGLLLEIQKISDVIHNEYKKKFRTVAWIDSAISAAAMSSHCLEEIYFTPQGNYGACTGWSGALQAVKGRELEEVLETMRKISARGGYNPLIMRAMQIQVPLSATVDANGEVKYYADSTSGDILVNRDGEILTFNAQTAERVRFSKGTASTIQDLQRLMGYQELEWVGVPVKNVVWPVSKAEKWNLEYRRRVHQDETQMQTYIRSFNQNIQAASSEQDRQSRGKFVNAARTALERIKAACKNNPNFALLQLNITNERELRDFFDEQERRLRDLMR